MNTTLDNAIKQLNAAICERIASNSAHIEGLCIEAKRGEETINVNEKSEPVFFDGNVDVYLYHKRNSINFSILRSKGKTVTYSAKAICTIYCCTSLRDLYEVLTQVLSGFNQIEIQDIDFDQYKIVRNETGLKDFDFSKNIFALKYTIFYSTDCTDICLN